MRSFLSVLAVVTASQAGAQSYCRAIANDSERLACYDQANQLESDGWQAASNRDPMTDVESVVIGVQSDEPTSCFDRKATLVFVCAQEQLSMVLDTQCVMGTPREEHFVEYRVDDGNLYRIPMLGAQGSGTVATLNATHVAGVLRRVASGEFLRMRVSPPLEIEQTMIFRVADATAALEAAGMQCGVPEIVGLR